MYEESSSNEGIDNEATVERMDVLKLNDWKKINNMHDASMDESFKNNNEAKRMHSWQSSSSHPLLREVSV